MKSIEIKLELNEKSELTTIDQVLDALKNSISEGEIETIKIGCDIDLKLLEKQIKEDFEEDITVRTGCTDGCYGARTGRSSKGLTLYIEATLFPDRFIDWYYCDEVVNIEALCQEYGTLLDLDADQFEDTMEIVGVESKSDNTYNYMGHDSETPMALCGADFSVYEIDDAFLVSIKFHCGGDVRGNYTSNVVYKFDNSDEFYMALVPSNGLFDDCDDEQTRLRELIKNDPDDRDLLIKELKELMGV